MRAEGRRLRRRRQVIDAEIVRRQLLEEVPIPSTNEEPVLFDTAEIPWWAWIRRFHLPEVKPPPLSRPRRGPDLRWTTSPSPSQLVLQSLPWRTCEGAPAARAATAVSLAWLTFTQLVLHFSWQAVPVAPACGASTTEGASRLPLRRLGP